MTKTIAEQAGELIFKNWRVFTDHEGYLMALDLRRAGLLTPDVPNVEYGLALDAGGTRTEGVNVALLTRTVSLIADDADSATRVVLTAAECRELGAWLLAAAQRIDA